MKEFEKLGLKIMPRNSYNINKNGILTLLIISISNSIRTNIINYQQQEKDNIMFENKHRCPSCGMFKDKNTDRDHYLTYALNKKYTTNSLISLAIKLDKLYTPLFLRDVFVN